MSRFVVPCFLLAASIACSRQEPLPSYSEVPDFSLTSERGETVTLDDLAGHIWVADFIFTNCRGPCPLMTSHMAKLQHALDAEGLPVKLVSVTVDPERDTPAVLKDYAERFGADLSRWSFLTGDKQAIHNLIGHGFKLASTDGSVREGEPGAAIVTHSVRFVLVDGAGTNTRLLFRQRSRRGRRDDARHQTLVARGLTATTRG